MRSMGGMAGRCGYDVLTRCKDCAHADSSFCWVACMAVTSFQRNHTCSYESDEMNGLESMSLIITIISLGNAFPTSPIEAEDAPEVRARLCTCALVQARLRQFMCAALRCTPLGATVDSTVGTVRFGAARARPVFVQRVCTIVRASAAHADTTWTSRGYHADTPRGALPKCLPAALRSIDTLRSG